MIKLIIQYRKREEVVECDTFVVDYVYRYLLSKRGRLAIITFKRDGVYRRYYFDSGIQYFTGNVISR